MAFSSGEGIASVQYETDTQLLLLFVSFMHNSEVCKERNRFRPSEATDCWYINWKNLLA